MILGKKKIILALSASIAAYKIPYLVRLLKKEGVLLKIVMTPSVKLFVSPLVLSTLSKEEIWDDFYDLSKNSWNNYVDLALWGDLLLVAPASANTISKMASGACDNILLATYLSARSVVFFAPAMDRDMYEHPATKKNISTLIQRGNFLIPAEQGELASGLSGFGRMSEPEKIVSEIKNYFLNAFKWKGKKVLISAGPTYENIDPIRYIGNYSSAKMGFELSKAASQMGAEVILVSGPTKETIPLNSSIKRIDVVSAKQMQDRLEENFPTCDILIMSAAVADYHLGEIATHKIKKEADNLSLRLVKNPDILKNLTKKKTHQYMVGFALETQNEKENALKKLHEKKLDLIILNSLNDKGAGFDKETNKVTLFSKEGESIDFPLKSKKEISVDILSFISEKI